MGILTVDDLKKNKNIKLTTSQKIGLKYYDDLLKKISRKESEDTQKLIESKLKKGYKQISKKIIKKFTIN